MPFEPNMKYRLVIGFLAVWVALVAVGCATSERRIELNEKLEDERAKSLIGMDLLPYYAQVGAANSIARNCAEIEINKSLDLEINEHRNKAGNGSFSAFSKRKEIRKAINEYELKLAGAYSVSMEEGEGACTIGNEELNKGTPLSILLDMKEI